MALEGFGAVSTIAPPQPIVASPGSAATVTSELESQAISQNKGQEKSQATADCVCTDVHSVKLELAKTQPAGQEA